MIEPLFKLGDRVVLVGDTNNDQNEVGWCVEMNDMIGETFSISRYDIDGCCMYKLNGDDNDYWYDEAWLAPAKTLDEEITDTTALDDFFSDLGCAIS